MTRSAVPTSAAFRSVQLPIILLALSFYSLAQELPKKIRGYKVQAATVAVADPGGASAKDGLDASVTFGEPKLAKLSLAGLTFELEAAARSMAASGTIELLTFRDFKVNGIGVEVDDYTGPVEFRRNQTLKLPKPIKISIGRSGILKAAWNELTETKASWTVTGRVFVFAKFRKFGMSFKRVVPLDIEFSIKNPLLDAKKAESPETVS